MPSKPPARGAAAKAASLNRASLIDEITAALRGMVELKAEPVIGEPGLVAVVGFIETDKIADVIRTFLEAKSC